MQTKSSEQQIRVEEWEYSSMLKHTKIIKSHSQTDHMKFHELRPWLEFAGRRSLLTVSDVFTQRKHGTLHFAYAC